MAKRYDATTKLLIEGHPADWLALAGLPVDGPVAVADADLPTGVEADKIIRVGGPNPYGAHFELQAAADPKMDERVLVYNALARRQLGLPIRSVVVVLRREADTPAMTGAVIDRSDPTYPLDFRYRIVRLWELKPKDLLAGGLGILPLAPLAADEESEVRDTIAKMLPRVEREVPPGEARSFWSATYVLLGLRHSPEQAASFLSGIRDMRESTTYQAILQEGAAKGRVEGRVEGRAEGRIAEAREMILKLGQKRLGPLSPASRKALDSIADVTKLESIVDRLLDARDWEDLLR